MRLSLRRWGFSVYQNESHGSDSEVIYLFATLELSTVAIFDLIFTTNLNANESKFWVGSELNNRTLAYRGSLGHFLAHLCFAPIILVWGTSLGPDEYFRNLNIFGQIFGNLSKYVPTTSSIRENVTWVIKGSRDIFFSLTSIHFLLPSHSW